MKKKTKTWLELATNDLKLAEELLSRKGRVYYAAHFCHQAIEKLLKAIIAERTDEIPFPTHNFKILLDQARLKEIPAERKRFIFNAWQMQPETLNVEKDRIVSQELYDRKNNS